MESIPPISNFEDLTSYIRHRYEQVQKLCVAFGPSLASSEVDFQQKQQQQQQWMNHMRSEASQNQYQYPYHQHQVQQRRQTQAARVGFGLEIKMEGKLWSDESERDGSRGVVEHGGESERCPLQLYFAALTFESKKGGGGGSNKGSSFSPKKDASPSINTIGGYQNVSAVGVSGLNVPLEQSEEEESIKSTSATATTAAALSDGASKSKPLQQSSASWKRPSKKLSKKQQQRQQQPQLSYSLSTSNSSNNNIIKAGYILAIHNPYTGNLSILDICLRIPTIQQRSLEGDLLGCLVKHIEENVRSHNYHNHHQHHQHHHHHYLHLNTQQSASRISDNPINAVPVEAGLENENRKVGRGLHEWQREWQGVKTMFMVMENGMKKWKAQMTKVGFWDHVMPSLYSYHHQLSSGGGQGGCNINEGSRGKEVEEFGVKRIKLGEEGKSSNSNSGGGGDDNGGGGGLEDVKNEIGEGDVGFGVDRLEIEELLKSRVGSVLLSMKPSRTFQ
jgi:hypothetical protein